MENLDGTVIATALPRMARSFGIAPIDLGIGMSAYLLTLGVFIPASGWVAERFGARRTFATAIALFTLASAGCGVTATVRAFVAMRVLQGVGGAMMVPVGRLIVLRDTPKERLVAAFATLTWPALVAPVLGPPVGGAIAEHLSWRWIFYLNVPLGLLALGVAWALVPRDKGIKARPFDARGMVLAGGSLVAFVAGLDLVGSPTIACSKVAALTALSLALGWLAWLHLRRTPHPLIDLGSFRITSFAVSLGGGSLLRMAIGAAPFLLPLMFQLGFGYDAIHAGLLTMAVFAGNLAMKVWTLRILRLAPYRTVLLINGCLNAAALALCATFHAGMGAPFACLVLFAGGLTRSLQFTTLNTMAFADVGRARFADANALFSTAMQVSMGLGVALGQVALVAGRWLSTAAALPPTSDFRIAFLLVAAVALLGTVDCVRLGRDVGAELSGRTRAA